MPTSPEDPARPLRASAWRNVIAAVGVVGAFVFGAGFVASYLDPLFAESVAREVVRIEVERRVEARLGDLDGGALAAISTRLQGAQAARIDAWKAQLAAEVPRRVAAIAARMLDADCACRRKIESALVASLEGRIGRLEQLNARLEQLIRTQYLDVAAALTREFRIFTGANALAFAALGLLALVRGRAGVHLLLPAGILLVATVVVGTTYVFGQDWLHAIVFGDFVGWMYFAYLGGAVAFLADVAFNHARMSTEALNGLFQLLGSAMHVMPC